MNLTILASVMIVVAVVEIFGFTAALLLMRGKLEELRMERDKFSMTFLHGYDKFLETAKELDEKREQILEVSNRQNAILAEQYEAIDGAYETMNERYRTIGDNYSKLLKCWEKVEDRYSDCYEQINEMNKHIDKLSHIWEEFCWSESPIDCSFNFAGECQNENCPALNMYCTVGDPKICRYSNLSEDPAGDDS